jgi:hypothetical protein
MYPSEEALFYTKEKLETLTSDEVLDVLLGHIADYDSDSSDTINAYDTIYERAEAELRVRFKQESILQKIVDYAISRGWSINLTFDNKGAKYALYHESYRVSNYIPLPHFETNTVNNIIKALAVYFKIE